jgi:hypothetical protein
MKALEAAFAAKKTSGRPAKKPKVEAKVVEEAGEDEDEDDDVADEDGDGLDDIFSKLKDKKKGSKKGGKTAANAKPAAAGKQGKGKQGAAGQAEGGGDDWFNSRGMKQSGRKYVDGLPVYTEDELRMNRGGGTTTLQLDLICTLMANKWLTLVVARRHRALSFRLRMLLLKKEESLLLVEVVRW